MFQNIELNAAHHLRFLVETLWSPKTMSLIKFPKVWVSMTAIIFCLCILWKACITWHFWATNRKLTFSWKIIPLGAIPPLKPANKGSGVVLLNMKDYVFEAHRQLQDTNIHQKLDTDLTQQFWDEINDLILDMFNNGEINSHTRIPYHPQVDLLFLLSEAPQKSLLPMIIFSNHSCLASRPSSRTPPTFYRSWTTYQQFQNKLF